MTLHELLDGHIRQTYRRTPTMADAIAREVGAVLAAGKPLSDWLLVRRVWHGYQHEWLNDRDDAFQALGRAEVIAVHAHRTARTRLLADDVPRLVPVTALLEDVDRADTATLPDSKEA